jgi:hypothetical protein
VVAPAGPGSCSQKWLTRIWVRDQEHDGPGMTGMSYRVPRNPVAPGAEVPHEDMVVMESLPVKSVITFPETNVRGARQRAASRSAVTPGRATGPVSAMHVSIDFGATWMEAELNARRSTAMPGSAGSAEVGIPSVGYYEIWARATDDAGVMQPAVVPGWNPRGYRQQLPAPDRGWWRIRECG